MPFYTTLVPPKPIVIPGQGEPPGAVGQGVERLGPRRLLPEGRQGRALAVSVGKKGEWNVDDTHCWSQFYFDGWRYLRFETARRTRPTISTARRARASGATVRAHGRRRDRRSTADAGEDHRRTPDARHRRHRTGPAIAGRRDPRAFFAEYETAADKTEEAVRLSRLRMPLPATAPELANPIRKLDRSGHEGRPRGDEGGGADARRRRHASWCVSEAKGAKSYDLWVSPYEDGRGAGRSKTRGGLGEAGADAGRAAGQHGLLSVPSCGTAATARRRRRSRSASG